MAEVYRFDYYSDPEPIRLLDSNGNPVLDNSGDYINDTGLANRPNNDIDNWAIGALWETRENGITVIYEWNGGQWIRRTDEFVITSGEKGVDWTASMQQTFEFYKVDPGTWGETQKLDLVKSGSITRDSGTDTLGNSRFVIDETIEECYIRVYLIVIQNKVVSRIPLGTFLCQSPSSRYNGGVKEQSVEAYTPLVELKEKHPPFGYSLRKGRNIINVANDLVWQYVRAPVVRGKGTETLSENFVSDVDDTWMSFFKDLLACADYKFGLDELSRIVFEPKLDPIAMRPVWTYNDDNSSILYPEITIERDLFEIPNVVEVIYSTDTDSKFVRVENNDPDSPISIVNRGREVVHRETDPDISGNVTTQMLKSYGRSILRQMSSVEFELTYTHGYCPVRVGDCVLLNYERAGIKGVKAVVTRQTIKLEPGCPVEETAVYTTSLLSDSWE